MAHAIAPAARGLAQNPHPQVLQLGPRPHPPHRPHRSRRPAHHRGRLVRMDAAQGLRRLPQHPAAPLRGRPGPGPRHRRRKPLQAHAVAVAAHPGGAAGPQAHRDGGQGHRLRRGLRRARQHLPRPRDQVLARVAGARQHPRASEEPAGPRPNPGASLQGSAGRHGLRPHGGPQRRGAFEQGLLLLRRRRPLGLPRQLHRGGGEPPSPAEGRVRQRQLQLRPRGGRRRPKSAPRPAPRADALSLARGRGPAGLHRRLWLLDQIRGRQRRGELRHPHRDQQDQARQHRHPHRRQGAGVGLLHRHRAWARHPRLAGLREELPQGEDQGHDRLRGDERRGLKGPAGDAPEPRRGGSRGPRERRRAGLARQVPPAPGLGGGGGARLHAPLRPGPPLSPAEAGRRLVRLGRRLRHSGGPAGLVVRLLQLAIPDRSRLPQRDRPPHLHVLLPDQLPPQRDRAPPGQRGF